jgi:ABC transport system ATP-binding/permease protein
VKPDSRQLSVLCERYLELILADKWNTLLLLAQAPVIAALIVVIWRDIDQVTDPLLFVLALSAIWFGTLNACREIVKEKDIFEREWMKGLNLGAYLWSKLYVLSLLGLAQCLALVFIVNAYVDLGDPPLGHLLVLFPASLAGTGLGLLISASVTTVDRSLTAVPILLIPQILFSELLQSHDHSSDFVKFLEKMAITTWTYEGLEQLENSEIVWSTVFWSLAVPCMMTVGFVLLAYPIMRFRLPGTTKKAKKAPE